MKSKYMLVPVLAGTLTVLLACNQSGGSGNNNSGTKTNDTKTKVKPQSDVLTPITVKLKDGRTLTFTSEDYLKEDTTYTSDSLMYLVQGGGKPKTYMVVGYSGYYDNGEGFIGTNGVPTKISNLPKGVAKFDGDVIVLNHDRFMQTRSSDNYHQLAGEYTKLNGDALLTANFDSGDVSMYIGTLSGESTVYTETDSSDMPGKSETRTDTVDPIKVDQTVQMGTIAGNRFEGKPTWNIKGDAFRYFNNGTPTRVRGGFYDENGETAMATFYSGTGKQDSETTVDENIYGQTVKETNSESIENFTVGTFVGTRQ